MHTNKLINRARRSVLKSIGLLGGLVAARQVQAHHTETHLDDTTAHRIVYQCNKADPEYLQSVLFSVGELLRKYGDDVEIVEFPYADDWYNNPAMLDPMENPSELWLKRDHKHDLAFRPLENALLGGTVDAIYTQSKVFQHLQEATGKIKMIVDLAKLPDWTLQVANTPAVITCTDVMAKEHPELVVAYMKAMVKVGRWANRNKRAAGEILNRQTFYLDAEDTYEGIKHVDMVPSLSAQNLACINIGKDFMVSHGYIKNDFDVNEWAAPEFLEQAATEVLKEEWERKSWSKLPKGGGLEVEGTRLG